MLTVSRRIHKCPGWMGMLGIDWAIKHCQLRRKPCWRPVEALFCFKVTLNFSRRKRKLHTEPDIESHQLKERFPAKLTKRMILSQINSIYDPLGLAGPFTVRAKIMMRKLWMSEAERLDWVDPVSDECRAEWNTFFSDLFIMNNIKFGRCLKPTNAVGNPMLVIFSDGSNSAYGACAYVRWALNGRGFESRLAISKNRLAPAKAMSIDRIELCGAVLSVLKSSWRESRDIDSPRACTLLTHR